MHPTTQHRGRLHCALLAASLAVLTFTGLGCSSKPQFEDDSIQYGTVPSNSQPSEEAKRSGNGQDGAPPSATTGAGNTTGSATGSPPSPATR